MTIALVCSDPATVGTLITFFADDVYIEVLSARDEFEGFLFPIEEDILVEEDRFEAPRLLGKYLDPLKKEVVQPLSGFI